MTTQSETMRNHWWWRPGWNVGRRFYTWHLTFEGQDEVHRIAGEYRSVLAPLGDILTPIPDRWLHLTMQGIGFVGEVKEEDVRSVVDAAGPQLAAIPAFDLQVEPAILDPEAVLLSVHPESPVRAVRDAIRSAIGGVFGEVPEKADGFTPHVSVAYSASDGPSAPIAHALSSLNPGPARARITSAELIVLHRDNLMYEWERFATVRLG
ncbi:2'-5' RNA ligase family protein [Streptomyces sp. NPDC088387]|uniref:2'-5' RNA ligase family protein n=1 Tax=Streptomyces sp. NPDC088387 TaxID=3365859 RepID=UPI00381A64EB